MYSLIPIKCSQYAHAGQARVSILIYMCFVIIIAYNFNYIINKLRSESSGKKHFQILCCNLSQKIIESLHKRCIKFSVLGIGNISRASGAPHPARTASG